MKGKKFDAHEKHFKEKEIKLKKEIKYLEEKYQDVCKDHLKVFTENIQLTRENIDIKARYEKLLEYSKLSDVDITEALQRDKSVNNLSALFDVIPKIIRESGYGL